MCERRKILEQNITEVKNRIHLGEQTLLKVQGSGFEGGGEGKGEGGYLFLLLPSLLILA